MFAKLFNTKTSQVLLEKYYEEEDYVLRITTEVNRIKVSTRYVFDNEDLRDKTFNEYGFPQAEEYVKQSKLKTS